MSVDRIRATGVRFARPFLAVLGIVLVGMLGGCRSLPPFTTSDPGQLLENARSVLDQPHPFAVKARLEACDAAWPSLKRIGAKHWESAESPEAFRLASWCFRRTYFLRRLANPDSPFLTSAAQTFMLEWLVHFFGDQFPQEQVDLLLVGMPYSLFQEFQAMVESRPELERWRDIYAEREGAATESVRESREEGD